MTPGQVTGMCEDAIAACDAAVDAIVATQDEECTFANTLGALEPPPPAGGSRSRRLAHARERIALNRAEAASLVVLAASVAFGVSCQCDRGLPGVAAMRWC